MRSTVLAYLKGLKLGTYKMSEELPFSNSNTPLYLKNVKTVYIDTEDYSTEEFIAVFNASIDSEVTTVRVFFANDAKKNPTEYNLVVNSIKGAKNLANANGYFRSSVDVTTTFEGDLKITEFEFRYTKLL